MLKLAKACKAYFESLQTWNLSISVKAYLQKLAKIHAFLLNILRKHYLQNLAKGVFIASPTGPNPGSWPASELACSACLPQMLHYPGMPNNLWRNTVTQLFQEHKIVCNLPDLGCSDIFFCFKSLSRLSQNDRISASLILLTLNVFSISLTLAKGRLKRTSLAIQRNLTDSSLPVQHLIVLLSPPRLNLPVTQFYNRLV